MSGDRESHRNPEQDDSQLEDDLPEDDSLEEMTTEEVFAAAMSDHLNRTLKDQKSSQPGANAPNRPPLPPDLASAFENL